MSLVHVIFHVIFFSREIDWKKSASLAIYITGILCWSSGASPPSVLQKFKFLASFIVQVKCIVYYDAVSVSSQLVTHITEVQAGFTLSVNAFELRHARGPSGVGLAQLSEDLICAPASQAYVERIFSVCGLLYSGRRSAMSKTQCAETSFPK